jgi:hypothetical protein
MPVPGPQGPVFAEIQGIGDTPKGTRVVHPDGVLHTGSAVERTVRRDP